MSRKALSIWIVIALVVLLLIALPFWRRYVIASQDASQLASARQALQAGNPQSALEIVARRRHLLAASAEEWMGLELDACVRTRNLPRLAAIYLEDPATVSRHELASLLLVRFLYGLRRESQAEALRKDWLGRESSKGAWLAVDVDRLLLDGKREQAMQLLRGVAFNNRDDCARLLRLALLTVSTPKESLAYLDAACRADPENPDARLFRAEVFEALGRMPQARIDYLAACNWQPNNPLLFHRLAEFYCRSGNPLLAADAWRLALKVEPLEAIWLRAWFWSRIAGGIDTTEWSQLPLPKGRARPFFEFLAGMPADKLWDEEGFRRLVLPAAWSENRQELFWCRLLQALHDNHLDQAASLLDQHDPAASLAPGLEKTLRWLVHRQLPPASSGASASVPRPTGSHPLYGMLERAAAGAAVLAPEERQLLANREVFAAACLGEGWMAAALFFHDPATRLELYPDWFVYGLAQSENHLHGPKPALTLLQRGKPTPLLACLEGELRLAAGDAAAARQVLAPLAVIADDVGIRAATLLALERLGAKAPAEAERLVNANVRLKETETGREILGQAAAARGDLATATAIFTALQNTSIVAKEFLAGRAFAANDFDQAKRLMMELMAAQPDEPRHAAQLKEIEGAAQKAKAGGK